METLPDLAFSSAPDLCTRCGRCVADCPVKILTLPAEGPAQMILEKSSSCFRCQHCLAICPHGAISILGRNPQESLPLAGNLPAPRAMEALMRGRRSTRSYKQENVPAEQIREVLEIAGAAPSGCNCRKVHWSVIADRAKLDVFRDKLLKGIEEAVAKGTLPPERKAFVSFPRAWREEKVDILFRGAPHFVATSAPRDAVTPQIDGIITLSYFELLANARGIGTVWDGLMYWALTQVVPQAREWLEIPADHVIGYCMSFGLPKVPFQRTVHHPSPAIHWAN